MSAPRTDASITPVRATHLARRACLLCAALIAIACDSPTASRPGFAYDPTLLSNGQLYRWRNGETVRVWVDEGGGAAQFDIAQSVRHAISVWNAEVRFGEFELLLVTSASEANILIFDRSRPVPITPGSCTFDARAAVGYTYFCVSGVQAERLRLASGANSTASVVIRVDRSLVSSQMRLDAIVAHEFGHALGLGAHSGESTDLMFGLPNVSTPSQRDRQTLQYVLGQPARITL